MSPEAATEVYYRDLDRNERRDELVEERAKELASAIVFGFRDNYGMCVSDATFHTEDCTSMDEAQQALMQAYVANDKEATAKAAEVYCSTLFDLLTKHQMKRAQEQLDRERDDCDGPEDD